MNQPHMDPWFKLSIFYKLVSNSPNLFRGVWYPAKFFFICLRCSYLKFQCLCPCPCTCTCLWRWTCYHAHYHDHDHGHGHGHGYGMRQRQGHGKTLRIFKMPDCPASSQSSGGMKSHCSITGPGRHSSAFFWSEMPMLALVSLMLTCSGMPSCLHAETLPLFPLLGSGLLLHYPPPPSFLGAGGILTFLH